MRLILLTIFIVVPLAEIALLIQVGSLIGVLATIALVVLTAVAGVAIIRRQGVSALRRARDSLDAGRLPVEPAIDGACLLVAGALLLTPGLITDAVGFALLVPGWRRGLARWALARLPIHHVRFRSRPPGPRPPRGETEGDGVVIDGEFTTMDDVPPRPDSPSAPPGRRPSPWQP